MNRHVLTLLFVTLVWGATFPVLKVATAQLSGVEISALRFLIAAVCMLPWALRAPRSTWYAGIMLGALVLVSYVLQAMGLQDISSNRSAFLTSLNVLMVPLVGVLFGARLRMAVLFAATLACTGIGLMSWDGGTNAWADTLTVLGALAYALYVIWLSKSAPHHTPRLLAATQIVCMGALGGVWMLVSAWGTDQLDTLMQRTSTEVWCGLLYLGVVATAAMLFLQAMAQRHVMADKAALVYSMEPVFAALFAWWWLHEGLTLRAALGALMVIGAIVWSELRAASQQE